MTGDSVNMMVGAVVSLLLAYFPGLKVWWSEFNNKPLGLALLGLVVSFAAVGLHYAGAVDLGLSAEFGWPVGWELLRAWLAFIGAGQATYTAERMLGDRNA